MRPDSVGNRSGQVSPEVIQLLSVLPSASMVLGAGGAVLWASPRSMAIGLVRRGQLAVPELGEVVAKAVAEGAVREEQLRVRRPPLGREWLDLQVRVAPQAGGSVLALVDDLSEERRVDAVRRDFVANISHELKTPVGALSLLAEAVLSASDDADQVRQFAQRMQIEAERLAHLIQDIIDLSRLQGDDPLLRAEPVALDALIQRAVDEVRTVATANDIDFVIGEPCGSSVYGDAGQLQTAVRNLLANAIAYSPAGTKVAIDARRTDALIEIVIKDQGVGIAANDLERIFERFYRVDPARSRVTGGTGLGLAIVKHVCQNHGGECTVWAEVGVGSTFIIRLPAHGSGGSVNEQHHSSGTAVDVEVSK
ncbi:MAG: sensor histidine kinase [Actinomycetales bacterium]